MSTVRVYKSTDPGAPAHPSATRGSMAALLRACLVEGWTSGDFVAEPAGWEEPYPEINNYACFRALEGTSRFFYQINDNQSDADVTRMTMFESMSDAETGIGDCGSDYFGKQEASKYRNFGWQVIADEKTCYVNLSSVYGSIPHGFGEFFSYKAEDARKAFMAGHTDSNRMCYKLNAAMQSSTGNYIRSASGLSSITPTNHLLSIGTTTTAGDISVNYEEICPSVPLGASYGVAPGYFRPASSQYTRRGKLRGVYYPLAYRPKTHLETFTHDGKTYIAIDSGPVASDESYRGQVWFDITGSWEESS